MEKRTAETCARPFFVWFVVLVVESPGPRVGWGFGAHCSKGVNRIEVFDQYFTMKMLGLYF